MDVKARSGAGHLGSERPHIGMAIPPLDYEQFRRTARRADQGGFAFVSVGDYPAQFKDTYVSLAVLAASTSCRVGVTVTTPLYQDPLVAAAAGADPALYGVPAQFHAACRDLRTRYSMKIHVTSGPDDPNRRLLQEGSLREYLFDRFALAGSPQDWKHRLKELRRRGIDRLYIAPKTPDREQFVALVSDHVLAGPTTYARGCPTSRLISRTLSSHTVVALMGSLFRAPALGASLVDEVRQLAAPAR